MKNIYQLTILSGLMAVAVSVQASLVLNGDFETGNLTGWTEVVGSGDSAGNSKVNGTAGNPHAQAGDGNYWFQFGAYAAHPTTISQTIATVAGGSYQLLFDYADDGTSGGLTVTLGGTTLATVSPSGSVQSDTVSFTATANNEQLVFAGYNPGTWTYLDNISVAAVPEPAAAGLLASMGLVAISVCSSVRLAAGRIRRKGHHPRPPIPADN